MNSVLKFTGYNLITVLTSLSTTLISLFFFHRIRKILRLYFDGLNVECVFSRTFFSPLLHLIEFASPQDLRAGARLRGQSSVQGNVGCKHHSECKIIHWHKTVQSGIFHSCPQC